MRPPFLDYVSATETSETGTRAVELTAGLARPLNSGKCLTSAKYLTRLTHFE